MSTVAYVASRTPIPQIEHNAWRPSLRHMNVNYTVKTSQIPNVNYTLKTSQVLPQAIGPDPVGPVLPALPALTSPIPRTFPLTYIADSGAGRTIYSERALLEQGVPAYLIKKFEATATEGISFVTGGGDRESSRSIGISSSLLGNTEAFKLKDAPLAAALGLIVEPELEGDSLAAEHALARPVAPRQVPDQLLACRVLWHVHRPPKRRPQRLAPERPAASARCSGPR